MKLIQPLLDDVSPQALQSIAGSLNETPEHTRQGIADALPMIMAGLISKAATMGGANHLLALLRDQDHDFVSVDRFARGQEAAAPANLFSNGGSMAESLLGNQYSGVADAIASHAGVARNSAQALLSLAAPLVLGGVAKAAPRAGFTPETLTRFLQGQKSDVLETSLLKTPAEMLGIHAADAPAVQRPHRNTLWPWAVGLAAALLIAILLGQWSTRREAGVLPSVTTPDVSAAISSLQLALPGGATLNVPEGSIGARLAGFLAGSEATPRTFAFENMNFDTGEVVLTPESIATLDSIATILRAYPSAAVRLEGHTDSTGDRAANLQISMDRASSVMNALAARGVERARMSAVGYGPDRPVGSNATEEGRAENRRLELTVLNR